MLLLKPFGWSQMGSLISRDELGALGADEQVLTALGI